MIYKYNKNINNYFFESRDIKVFPCSYRGYYTTEDNSNYTFDPESRLNTEYNFVNLPGFNGHDSYIISYTNSLLKCVIGGYYFEVNLTDIANITDKSLTNRTAEETNLVNSLKGASLYIKTNSISLTAENHNEDISRNTAILGSFDSESTVSLDSYYMGAPNFIDTKNTYLFTGLVLGKLEEDDSYDAELKVFNDDDNLTINKREQLPMLYHGAGDKSIVLEPETNIATAERSIALGYNTNASQTNQVVVGQYNATTTGEFVVGKGKANTSRKNAFVVNEDISTIDNSLKIVTDEKSGDMTVSKTYMSIIPGTTENITTKFIITDELTGNTSLIIDNTTENEEILLSNPHDSQALELNSTNATLQYSEYSKLALSDSGICLDFQGNKKGKKETNASIMLGYNLNKIDLENPKETSSLIEIDAVDVDVNGRLRVNGGAQITSGLIVGGKTHILNDFTVGNVNTHRKSSLYGNLEVEANSQGEKIYLNGNTTIGTNLTVKNNTFLHGGLTVNSTTTLPGLVSTSNKNKMTTDVVIDGHNLTVANGGSTTLEGDTTAYGNIHIKGTNKLIVGDGLTKTEISGGLIKTVKIDVSSEVDTPKITNCKNLYATSSAALNFDDSYAPGTTSGDSRTGWNLTSKSSAYNVTLLANNGITTVNGLLIDKPTSWTSSCNLLTVSEYGDEKFVVKNSGSVTASGEITAPSFNATSDRRLKENIIPFISEKSILDLPIYKYDYIDGSKDNIGCIAQELQEICPELVSENEKGYLLIKESKLVYLLLDEVKKLNKRIETLEKGV